MTGDPPRRAEAGTPRPAGATFYLLVPGDWWPALDRLRAVLACEPTQADRVQDAYASLVRSLADAELPDLASAAAATLLWTENAVSERVRAAAREGDGEAPIPAGLRAALRHDLWRMHLTVTHPWTLDAQRVVGDDLPPLEALAPPLEPDARTFADPFVEEAKDTFALEAKDTFAAEAKDTLVRKAKDAGEPDMTALLERLLERYRRHGAGPLARHAAYRWTGESLEPLPAPDRAGLSLVGVDTQLERLAANTERFLAGRPAQHTLLYGPRGSGKSTAIRHQLARFHAAGLRLIEVPAERLGDLPTLLGRLAGRPHRYLLFVDDLAFEAGDASYRPLRTLLEGSLGARLDNALIYATSNRRHLVRERFSDRPDPLDDDVHAWDTQHERLALADRFGLVITFPDANQRRYLAIVQGIAEREGLGAADLSERALRFADWGNGYSGRTARQFIDLLRAERA